MAKNKLNKAAKRLLIDSNLNNTLANALSPSMLLGLFAEPISFNPEFVEMTGNITSALMLSYGITIGENDPAYTHDGWVRLSAKDWQMRTGLSVYQQEEARRILRDLHFMEEKLTGMPARLSQRFNGGMVMHALQEHTSKKYKIFDEN